MAKTIIVTGASRGIGAAIVRALLVNGVRVIGMARSEEALRLLSLEKIGGGGRFEYVVGDLCDRVVCEKVLQLAGNVLDGLILNAAMIEPVKRTVNMNLDEMRQLYEVNLFANIQLVQMALPLLRQSPSPRLIGISSGVVNYAIQGMSAYSSSKAAFANWMSVLAREEPWLLVASIKPGIVDTTMSRAVLEHGDQLGDQEMEMQSNERVDATLPASVIARIATETPPPCASGVHIHFNEI